MWVEEGVVRNDLIGRVAEGVSTTFHRWSDTEYFLYSCSNWPDWVCGWRRIIIVLKISKEIMFETRGIFYGLTVIKF